MRKTDLSNAVRATSAARNVLELENCSFSKCEFYFSDYRVNRDLELTRPWTAYNGGASMDLPKLWAQITADLEQARSTLLNDAANDKAISQYKEFLSHNELELACDMLESYAETHTVNREFWLALRDAAAKMELYDRSRRYEGFANSPETTA
jgi:hypothetical protein